MEGRLLLKDCSIFRADGRVRGGMAVVVEQGRITRVSADASTPVLPGDWEVACRGRLVMPGLVDCHSHLVTGQLVPTGGTFLLQNPRLRFELQDRACAALTATEVGALAAYGMARALRSGITLTFEHLHAPADTSAALHQVAAAARELGLRTVLSHSTHSGPGPTPFEAQLQANGQFAQSFRSDPLVRGALGFHSSATANDDLLRRVGRMREELGVGAHFHLAESEDDLTATFAEHGRRIVPRLEAFGLLGPGGIGAFGRAVDRTEAERLARSRTLVALSPWAMGSDEQQGGGLEILLGLHPLLGLGSAGAGSLWRELLTAFSTAIQMARLGRLLDPDSVMSQVLVSGPAELCSMIFGAPSGNVEEGCLADLVVYDHVPPDGEVTGPMAQLLLQLANVPVAWTLVNGRVVVREGALLGHDVVELGRQAARALESVWQRVGAHPHAL
jgi:5-methylthioadenosine/S-adenosylhomocysteine deaminase